MVVDIPLILIKTAAVTGIGFVWANFTVKAFQMAWHVISTSPKKKKSCRWKKLQFVNSAKNIFWVTGMNWNRISSYVGLAVFCIEKKIS